MPHPVPPSAPGVALPAFLSSAVTLLVAPVIACAGLLWQGDTDKRSEVFDNLNFEGVERPGRGNAITVDRADFGGGTKPADVTRAAVFTL